nr:heterokaryon incompatibility protein s [Quercus suber]
MEVAGLIISGVGVAALASTVSTLSRLAWLDLARLGYDRWCRNVKFVDVMNADFDKHLPVATTDEVKTVKKLLGSIRVAFETARETSKRFELDAKASTSEQPVVFNNGASHSATVQLADRVRTVSKQQQKAANIIDKLRWTLFDAKTLKELVTKVRYDMLFHARIWLTCGIIHQIDRNVNSLVSLFPAIRTAQKEQAATDVAAIVPPDAYSTHSQEKLKILQRNSAKIDPALRLAIRNTFSGIYLEDSEDVVVGDKTSGAKQNLPKWGQSFEDIRAKRVKNITFGTQQE